MNIEIDYLWSHKCPKKWDQYTLIAFVITVIILLILVGITIIQLTNSGLLSNTKEAKEETEKKNAIEIINLKIANIKIKSFEETQKLPDLQYIANELCKDTEVDYVKIKDKETPDINDKYVLPLITVGENDSIIIKLKTYDYEFEIDNKLTIENVNKTYEIEEELEGETADELVEKMNKDNSVKADMIGKEVTYIKYKDKNGNEQNKWLIIYIGKNTDTSVDIKDDMPNDENHIYIIPKYSITNVSPSREIIIAEKRNEIAEPEKNNLRGFLSTQNFRDAMRDSDVWSDYTDSAESKAHGAMSVAQYNMCVSWAGRNSHLGNGDGYWLDDPTWSNAIARVDPNGSRSGNGLCYWYETYLCIRPIVMLSNKCKLNGDDIAYRKKENIYNGYWEMNANQIAEKFQEKSWQWPFMQNKEVEYINYKDKNGTVQNKWKLVYIGKINDSAEDIVDDMPNNENHMYLIPKYSIINVQPSGQKILAQSVQEPIEASVDKTSGYSSTAAFKDAMRNSDNWTGYAKGNGTKVHGAMSVAQYNLFSSWFNAEFLGNGDWYWLDDPTWSNAIARVDPDGSRSGNGLCYWHETYLHIRPLVMLGPECKLTSENKIK